jgi:membrane protease YdiL (CAAX protease family)
MKRAVRFRLAVAFAVLFVAYQLPEGLGQHVLHSLAVQGTLMVAFLPIAWAVGRWLGFRGFDAYALEWQRGSLWLLVVPFAAAVAVKAIALGLGGKLGIYAADPAHAQPFSPALLGFALLATFFPSIAEDILTRGFFFRAAPLRTKAVGFVVISSAIYVLNHVYRLANGPREWLMLFCYGLAYAAALARTGSLWAAVGLHWGANFAGTLLPDLIGLTVQKPAQSPLLSAASHLVLLVLVVPLLARPQRVA